METSDNNIVDEFENLNVLSTYDFQKMDELVQDLTNALEESSQKSASGAGSTMRASLHRYHRKRRGRRRRSYPSVLLEQGNFSEASESSLDEALKDYMESMFQQSDSDDLLKAARHLPALAIGHALSLAESDSVTENFSPMRTNTHRRRRRGKRMAVDQDAECDVSDPVPTYQLRDKRLRCKIRTLKAQHENIMELERYGELGEASGECMVSGKRKRSTGQEVECGCGAMAAAACVCHTAGQCSSYAGMLRSHCHKPGQPCSKECKPLEAGTSKGQESSSSLSSSESDCGIFTNDEARDGDDEQSDFFHETGPACGVPGIIPWWETDKIMEGEVNKDSNFEDLLSGTYDIMSPTTKRTFKARVSKFLSRSREIRMGRRRLKDRRCGYPASRYKQDSSRLENAIYGAWSCGVSPGTISGDIKRRRQMPPPCPTAGPESAGYFRDPVPQASSEANAVRLSLPNLGWPIDNVLASSSRMMPSPGAAYVRAKRKGQNMQSS